MALSPQDKAYYEEKLALNSFGYFFGATVLIGAIAWPLVFYIQDWSIGQTDKWDSTVVSHLAIMGGLLGSVISVIMYLIFKFFLEIGWLPKRR